MFNCVTWRRGLSEGVVIYTLGRLGALITPAIFPDWLFVVVPLFFLVCQYLLPAFWATNRIASPKRERLSKRFWLLGLCLAVLCLAIDLLVSLSCGLAVGQYGVQEGPVLLRFVVDGARHLSLLDFVLLKLGMAALLFALFPVVVICTRLARGGFLRFTMPAGGNRVTL